MEYLPGFLPSDVVGGLPLRSSVDEMARSAKTGRLAFGIAVRAMDCSADSRHPELDTAGGCLSRSLGVDVIVALGRVAVFRGFGQRARLASVVCADAKPIGQGSLFSLCSQQLGKPSCFAELSAVDRSQPHTDRPIVVLVGRLWLAHRLSLRLRNVDVALGSGFYSGSLGGVRTAGDRSRR